MPKTHPPYAPQAMSPVRLSSLEPKARAACPVGLQAAPLLASAISLRLRNAPSSATFECEITMPLAKRSGWSSAQRPPLNEFGPISAHGYVSDIQCRAC